MRVQGHRAPTPPWCSTATTSTGGPPTPCGCRPCAATATCGCWTAAARSGWRAGPHHRRPASAWPPDYDPVERARRPEHPRFRDQVATTSATAAGWSTCARPANTPASCWPCPTTPPGGALRGGHIPARPANALEAGAARGRHLQDGRRAGPSTQGELGLKANDDIVAYCRIGERSSHTWFVLSQLLGLHHVRNYDGSWVEWGNSVRVPIERSSEPGPTPASRRSASKKPWPCRPGSPRSSRSSPHLLARAAPGGAAGLLAAGAAAARAPGRPPRGDGAGAGVPDAVLPGHRAGRRRPGDHPLRRPPEAPTTRGFAGILSEGLNGATAAEVLAVPNGFYTALGLDRVISPLRLRGSRPSLAGSSARSASRSRPGRPDRRRL